MSNARNLANITSGAYDIPSAALDNAVPADGSITAAKLASSLDLTGKSVSLPSAAVTPADGSITQAKVSDAVGGFRPQWTEIRLAGLQTTNSILEWSGTGIYVNNGNNGNSARGRLQGSAKGVFRVKFELAFWWGWSQLILYPRDLWEATAGTDPVGGWEPTGRKVVNIMNNSSNNARIIDWWDGSTTSRILSSSGANGTVWTIWRDSSNYIRVFDGSNTINVGTSTEDYVILSGRQSPHYTRIYEAGSYV